MHFPCFAGSENEEESEGEDASGEDASGSIEGESDEEGSEEEGSEEEGSEEEGSEEMDEEGQLLAIERSARRLDKKLKKREAEAEEELRDMAAGMEVRRARTCVDEGVPLSMPRCASDDGDDDDDDDASAQALALHPAPSCSSCPRRPTLTTGSTPGCT